MTEVPTLAPMMIGMAISMLMIPEAVIADHQTAIRVSQKFAFLSNKVGSVTFASIRYSVLPTWADLTNKLVESVTGLSTAIA